MLCFKLSNESVLDAGSNVFTDNVGVNVGILNAVLMLEYFWGGICGNFTYKYG